MQRIAVPIASLLCIACFLGIASQGEAEEQRSGAVQRLEGRIRSTQIECSQPLSACEGSIILADTRGGEVTLAVRAGTWIRHGERFVSPRELAAGIPIRAQTFRMVGDALPRAALIELIKGDDFSDTP